MRNSVIGVPKKSDLELRTNLQIVLVFLTMLVCCACAASYVLIWDRINEAQTNVYLVFYPEGTQQPDWTASRSFDVWIKNLGTWILLFTNMVPISLLVTLEVVKFF